MLLNTMHKLAGPEFFNIPNFKVSAGAMDHCDAIKKSYNAYSTTHHHEMNLIDCYAHVLRNATKQGNSRLKKKVLLIKI